MLKFAAPSLSRFIEECQEHGVKTVSFSDREVEFIFTAPSVYSGTEGSTPILLELKYLFVGMVPSINWRERTKTKLFERFQQAGLEVREGIWMSATETIAVPWRESDLDEIPPAHETVLFPVRPRRPSSHPAQASWEPGKREDLK